MLLFIYSVILIPAPIVFLYIYFRLSFNELSFFQEITFKGVVALSQINKLTSVRVCFRFIWVPFFKKNSYLGLFYDHYLWQY